MNSKAEAIKGIKDVISKSDRVLGNLPIADLSRVVDAIMALGVKLHNDQKGVRATLCTQCKRRPRKS